MRRIIVVVAVTALLGSLLAGVAFAKKPSAPSPGTNSSPHFVPNSFSGFQDPNSGVVELGYSVAGLGKNGYGYIVASGEITVSAQCEKRNHTIIDVFLDHVVHVAEHDIFGDRNGNYFDGKDYLRPSAVCPPGATLVPGTATYLASNVTVTLYSDPSKPLPYYDTYTYAF